MQHLGEICWAQRSRGKCGQDTRRVKARKGFSNRRFERRFWVLLPPRAKVPRAGARNIPLDNPPRGCSAPVGAAGGCGHPPLRTAIGGHSVGGDAHIAPQG